MTTQNGNQTVPIVDDFTEVSTPYTPSVPTFAPNTPPSQHKQPLGIEGDSRYIDDLVRSDSALRSLIQSKNAKGVPYYRRICGEVTDEQISTRYIVPMRKGEFLVLYEHPHPLPQRVLYDDDLDHSIVAYFYKNGKEVSLCSNDEVELQ